MLIRVCLCASCLLGAGASPALPLLLLGTGAAAAGTAAASPAGTAAASPAGTAAASPAGMAAASPASAAAARVGEAEVREGAAGLPCFTIAEREERRSGAPNFEAISVTEVPGTAVAGSAPGPARAVVWSMTMPAGRTFPLMYSMCVPYGGRVAALPQRSAELLEAGKLYEVAIAVRADGAAGNSTPPQSQSQSLVARFCLLRRADGGNSVGPASACARPRKR